MKTPEPIAAMDQWVRDSPGALLLPLTVSLELEAKDADEAMSAILDWISMPRNPLALRTAEITLRAFIDFECALGTSDAHQDMIDSELLSAADAAIIPPKNRKAINVALGARPRQRQLDLEAAEAWRAVRPTNQAICEWWWHRFQETINSLQQPPNQ